ncbi:MAG: glycoside hydrolase family 3 N-terminal domain-containing protein [Candidatus Freyarchaeum deiterrae]
MYRDSSIPIEERVEDLLSKMSLEEKIGQMTGFFILSPEIALEAVEKYHAGAGAPFLFWEKATDLVNIVNVFQSYAVEKSRLGIPLLLYTDADHGHAFVKGTTVFPHNLGMASTWDPDFSTKVAGATAGETRATGIHQNLNPVCDIARDPRWGRTYETFGESPYLCSVMAAAMVRGYQGGEGFRVDDEHLAATAKHFPAYSSPEGGEDAAPVDVSEYTFHTIHLPSFEAAVRSGVLSVMPCYNEINGKPAHGSYEYLTELLRNLLGFRGIVVSDWGGVEMLYRYHRTAESYKDAVKQAVEAGLDIDSIGGARFYQALLELVNEGEVSERRIDTSVRRILGVKFRLDLFNKVYVDPEKTTKIVGSSKHKELALQASRKSIVLLKNENLLPLKKNLNSILVTGPNADNLEGLLGGWTNHLGPWPSAMTVLEAIKTKVSSRTEVSYMKGAGYNELENLDEVKEKAKGADVAVAVLGEYAYMHEFWNLADLAATISLDTGLPSAEPTKELKQKLLSRLDAFPSRAILELPDAQLKLVNAIHETGTPTIVVLLAGRPLTVRWIAENIPALLVAFYPGLEGGTAIADVLFGDYNPGGKLPISIPRSVGQIPARYNYKTRPFREIHPPAYAPLYEFGHGLSYTRFEYSDLEVSPKKVGVEGRVNVSVTVRNAGEKAGDEVVQLYVNDVCSSRVTPIKELKGFERLCLKPDESKRLTFTLNIEDLAVYRDKGRFAVEPGLFKVMIGASSENIKLEDDFNVESIHSLSKTE